jgi:disulfide bond formation protein DsbB
MPDVTTLNLLLAIGTLGMQMFAIGLLLVYFLRERVSDLIVVSNITERYGLYLAFLITLSSTIISLYYSNILGLVPCWLCWLQRIFIYPQVILFAVAIWKKDFKIADYSIALSVVGSIISLYQHYLQMGGESVLPCPTSPGAGDCAQRFLFEFGYITFPLIAFITFMLLIVLMLFIRKRATI